MAEIPSMVALKQLALEAGKMIAHGFHKQVTYVTKEDDSPVTPVDMAINTMVLEKMEQYPDVSVIAEEGSRVVKDAEYTIFCDPLDGTIPFMRGYPCASFSIALLQHGIPVQAIIFEPFSRRLWEAQRGQGTRLNDHVVQVRTEHRALKKSAITVLNWHSEPTGIMGRVDKALLKLGVIRLNAACASLPGALVSSGHEDAVFIPAYQGLEAAAIQLLVEEAGGRVTDFSGNPMVYNAESGAISDGCIASNGLIHDELLSLTLRYKSHAYS